MGIDAGARGQPGTFPSALTINPMGTSPFVLVCDHASNRIPAEYSALGLSLNQRLMHIAWDPGALAVALQLGDILDAPLVHSTVSRLVIDCNRSADAVDLIPVVSERTEIPGNKGIGDNDRANRIGRFHAPFHNAIAALLDARSAAGRETVLVTVHSFTPIYKDVQRPWPVGLIHGADERFSRALFDALESEDAALKVGWNEPYSARSGVTFTLEHHGDERGLDAVMIEIRHDEILEPTGIGLWAARLGRCLETARATLHSGPHTTAAAQPGLGAP